MSDRFPRVTTLTASPGVCFTCRKDKCESGFTDLGMTDDWLGAFYICDDCVKEIARGIGMRTVEEIADMRGELGQTRIELSQARGELTTFHALQKLIREFSDAGTMGGPGGGTAGSGGSGGGSSRRRATQPRGAAAVRPLDGLDGEDQPATG